MTKALQVIPGGQGRLTGNAIIQTFQQRLETALASDQMDLLEVQRQALSRREIARNRATLAELVFAYYCGKLNHPRALFNSARERLICRMLETNDDDINALLYAIDGVEKDDWVMGRSNDSVKRFDTPEFIFRNWGQVERFAETRIGFNAGRPHPLAVKYGICAPEAEGKKA